jgi:hypothetical protein
MTFDIPTADTLTKFFSARKAAVIQQDVEKLKACVDHFLTEFAGYLKDLMESPQKYTSRHCFVEPIASEVYALRVTSKSGADIFVEAVGAKLRPLGYTVIKSHDGGGIYATIVVSWKKTS